MLRLDDAGAASVRMYLLPLVSTGGHAAGTVCTYLRRSQKKQRGRLDRPRPGPEAGDLGESLYTGGDGGPSDSALGTRNNITSIEPACPACPPAGRRARAREPSTQNLRLHSDGNPCSTQPRSCQGSPVSPSQAPRRDRFQPSLRSPPPPPSFLWPMAGAATTASAPASSPRLTA